MHLYDDVVIAEGSGSHRLFMGILPVNDTKNNMMKVREGGREEGKGRKREREIERDRMRKRVSERGDSLKTIERARERLRVKLREREREKGRRIKKERGRDGEIENKKESRKIYELVKKENLRSDNKVEGRSKRAKNIIN